MSSTDSSSSRLSSDTPSLSIQVPKKKKKKSTKDKGTDKLDQGKNEGVNPNWAYVPPPGSVLIEEDDDADAGEFDWDKINDDDDLELCLIRVPDSVKPKYLQNIQLHEPLSSISESTTVGTLKRKYATFDIWSLGDNGDNQPVGGEELKSLSCLLPRKKKKGKLYPAPKPFARHLLISAQSVVPTPCTSSSSADAPLYKNPPRQSYPKEVLKHQFMPYGSLVNVTNEMDIDIDTHEEETVMDVDIEDPEPQPTASPKTKKKKKREKTADKIHIETPLNPSTSAEVEPDRKKAKTKGKKRKGESTDAAESPVAKKSKKLKT